jgi:ubiquinone/menaquinone biosynthesis C-methylase UbiE
MYLKIGPVEGVGTTSEPVAATANEEAIEAWDGVLFDRFLQFRDIILPGLGAHGEEALRVCPPRSGDRVLDIGCGFGDTTQRLAGLVGPEGEAVGFDASERFVEAAREEAERAGVDNVRFAAGDVQAIEFAETFDHAFSRFGTMFFANPVVALRNVRRALRPGGRLCMVVWRRKLDNDWIYRSEQVAEKYLEEPEDSDEPTCGPGPFSMANADTVTDVLVHAGYREIALRRCDTLMRIGNDLDHAVAYVMALGPAGEIIRLARDEAERIRPKLAAEIGEALSDFERDDGVWGPMSTWIITATAPNASD